MPDAKEQYASAWGKRGSTGVTLRPSWSSGGCPPGGSAKIRQIQCCGV